MLNFWLDCETTNTDPNTGFAFQYAYLIEKEGKILSANNIKMRPVNTEKYELNPTAFEINKIDPATLFNYELEENALKILKNDLKPFSTRLCVCGYNVQFDIEFLKATLSRNGLNYFDYFQYIHYDVMQLVRGLVVNNKINVPNIKLATIAKYFKLPFEKEHDAIADILVTKQINDIIMGKFNLG